MESNTKRFKEMLGEAVIHLEETTVVDKRYPSGCKMSAVGGIQQKNGEFKESVRIDNHRHKGSEGMHMHNFTQKNRKGKEIIQQTPEIRDLEQAADRVKAFLKHKHPKETNTK